VTEDEIAGLMKGIAPAVKQFVAREMKPLQARIAKLETKRSAQRSAVAAELLRRTGAAK